MRWKGRRGGQGPPPEKLLKGGAGGGGRLKGEKYRGRGARSVSFAFCFCLFRYVHRYAWAPHHNGRILLRRVTVRGGQDQGGDT